jgi:hypothetical protein
MEQVTGADLTGSKSVPVSRHKSSPKTGQA